MSNLWEKSWSFIQSCLFSNSLELNFPEIKNGHLQEKKTFILLIYLTYFLKITIKEGGFICDNASNYQDNFKHLLEKSQKYKEKANVYEYCDT